MGLSLTKYDLLKKRIQTLQLSQCEKVAFPLHGCCFGCDGEMTWKPKEDSLNKGTMWFGGFYRCSERGRKIWNEWTTEGHLGSYEVLRSCFFK